MNQMNQNVETNENAVKRVVVYEADKIQGLLDEMNGVLWQVRGIECMNCIVKTFDTLRTQGSLQDAQLANGEFVSTEFPMPENNTEAVPAGNEEVVYDAEEDAAEVVEAAEIVDAEYVEE